MKIAGWLIFVALNFWLLFFYTKKFERPSLIRWFILLIPIAMVVAVIAMLVIFKVLKLDPNQNFADRFFSIFISIVIISGINLFNQLFHFMVDTVVSFHQKNNAANLNRQPIKFLVSNQNMLKQIATIIWFLGSALMLYGVWLNTHVQ